MQTTENNNYKLGVGQNEKYKKIYFLEFCRKNIAFIHQRYAQR